MPYNQPGITLNLAGAQSQGVPAVVGRTILALSTFPKGPDTPVFVDPSQAVSVFGDPASPASSGHPGPMGLFLMRQQSQPTRSSPIRFLVCRVGVTRASANAVDSGSAAVMSFVGIGAYAGSAGNNLQVVVNAPQVSVSELVRGNANTAEVQVITFYGLGGSPTGGVVLSFSGTPAGAPITAATITGGGAAAALATYLTGISTIGTGCVTVVALAAPATGAFSFQLTYASTKATGQQPLVTMGTNTFAAGTGTIPVASVQINDTSSGSAVQKQSFTAGQFDLSTAGKIYQLINSNNPLSSLTSIVQATTLAANANLPKGQTLTLAGGLDGLGATSSDATIAPLLTASLAVNGTADFIWTGFDAAAVSGTVLAHIQSAAAVGQLRKAVLGPSAGTTYASLIATYQQAQTDRVVIVGHDSVVGVNPANGVLNQQFDGWHAAAVAVGLKAVGPEEYNCVDFTLAGITDVGIAPDNSSYLSVGQLNALAGAGFTVFYRNQATGRLALRDFITTAPGTNAYNQDNPLKYFSIRDSDDLVANSLMAAFATQKGLPQSGASTVTNIMQSIADGVMGGLAGRVTNGASAKVVFDPLAGVVTVNVVYQDRPPQNNMVINIAFAPSAPVAS